MDKYNKEKDENESKEAKKKAKPSKALDRDISRKSSFIKDKDNFLNNSQSKRRNQNTG